MASLAEIEMIDSLHLIKFQIIDLNKKLTEFLEIIRIVRGIPVESVLNCTKSEFIWSIECIDDFTIIKFNYEKTFSDCVKRLSNFKWNNEYQGYILSENIEFLIKQIKKTFPEWRCIDKRN